MPSVQAGWIYAGCMLVAAALSFGWRQHRENGVHRCWDLVPVVVASRALTRGAPLTYDDLSQRSVPEQFLRRRDVRPEQVALLVGLSLRDDLEAGEPILWSDVPGAPR